MSDVLAALDAAIEKAVSFRGERMSPAQRRLVAGAGSNPSRVWREGGRSNFMRGGRTGKRVSVDGRQAKTTPSRTQRAISARLRKALIKPGKPSLGKRIGFLLSTNRSERNYKIGRYLEGRKAGKGFGPKGKRRARTGTYTGVYATGVNKSEQAMTDVVDELYEAIEKAKGLIPRGGSGRLERVFARRNDQGKRSGKGKSYAFRGGYLSTRRKGGVTGQGQQADGRYRNLHRTTKPGSYKR